jgi:hypothetical protein
MAESRSHIVLVSILVQWIADSLLDGDRSYIIVDDPDSSGKMKPPMIGHFVPDVFVSHTKKHLCVIGEAKTSHDIDNTHTIQQIDTFLQKCGESGNSLFVLAVPWHRVGLAASLLDYRKRKMGLQYVKSRVLEKLPG